MKRKPYPSDLSDAQWAILEPLMPQEKHNGRPRHVHLREIIKQKVKDDHNLELEVERS